MIRKIMFYIILILFWNITLILFPVNYGYITTLNGILDINYKYLIIIYFIITLISNYEFYKLFIEYDLNNNYNFVYILNYIFTEIFGLFFFYFNNLLLSLICLCIVFISNIFKYIESKKINRLYSFFEIPSIIFNIFILINFIKIMILN